MAGASLLALIDDIATVLDDIAILTKVAAKKTAGVLGDDLALNAQQVSGVRAERELPVVWAVAVGSFKNKLILVPAALAISRFLPWAVTPLLMIGGLYLCLEGVEKIAHQWLQAKGHDSRDTPDDESHDRFPSSVAVGIPACTPESFAGQGACSLNSPPHPARGEGSVVSRLRDFHINGDGAADAQHAEKLAALADDSVDLAALEADKIKGAIRTDFVLSAEIVVIALGTVAGASFTTQVAVLSGIGVLMTVGVYGIVAGIVKLDDLGLYLLKKSGAPAQAVGKALVLAAPRLMKALTVIGTAAMFMVGGSILSHGLPPVHHFIENAAELAAAVGTVGGVLKALSSLSLEMLVGVVGGSLALLATQAFATLRGAVRRKSERPADPRPDPEQHP